MDNIDIATLYRQHGAMVFRRCKRLLGDERLSEDAMQDVFVRLLQYEPNLEDRGMTTLLYRIATQVCLNRLRSQRRRPESSEDELLLRIAHADDLERQTLGGDLLARVFGREPASTRVLATLHFVDGLTLEEVARETGMSASGVRKRLHGLKTRLLADAEVCDVG